ncbi:hypothetical protein C2S52_016542 [Perilla frutescens var. hirtella]|uniref:DUF7870 domain-containing protein n=1 Tax=Perilla frutescens var. hirtella TaxID=608512 RepID=A0AAD4PER1_PERFH|nr:hypothetical protein C2S52_016542 [Perilla frutescens var. hirtella]KAH6810401.1 hypothetical protein C2S51_024163 [Perilla frutescens var. frutescens]KAH6836516.1 hypothetical protein C2S53_005135 [Perilla frutescens var. hirtella]
MDLNFLKWQLIRGPFVRRVLLRAFMLVLALIVISLMQMAREIRVIEPIMSNVDECPLNVNSNQSLNRTTLLNSASGFTFPLFGASATACVESENLIRAVFEELMGKKLLHSNARALCVGEGSSSAVVALRGLGLTDAFGVDKHPFFSLFKRRFVYELDFEDNHFDFAFSGDLDRVSVPALLVLEIERVLCPGGTGAMLVGGRRLYSGGLVRSAATVASFLKSSDVVQLCGFDSFSLVIFKKRPETRASFEQFQLPADCPSVAKNKPFMKHIEPLTDKNSGLVEPGLSYLPNFMNISSRNKLVFINIGAGEFAKKSVSKMSKLYRSSHLAAMEVFIIDHKTSVLSSYVTDPGTSFVYYPALGGDTSAPEMSSDEHLVAPLHEEEFDFISWFEETVSDGDFAILMMNAKSVELSILVEMFKTGAICHVDELFLRCEDTADSMSTVGNCTNLFTSLRKSGVYVHQWLGD